MSSPSPRVVTGAPFSVQRVDVRIAVDFGLVPASSRQSSRIVQGCNVYCEVLGLFYRLIILQVLTDYESEECPSRRHSKHKMQSQPAADDPLNCSLLRVRPPRRSYIENLQYPGYAGVEDSILMYSGMVGTLSVVLSEGWDV